MSSLSLMYVVYAIWVFVITPLFAFAAYNKGKANVYRIWSKDLNERADMLRGIMAAEMENELQRMINKDENS